MIFYLSIGQLQQEFSHYYQSKHACCDFRIALTNLYERGDYITQKPDSPDVWQFMLLDDTAFLDAAKQLYYAFSSEELFKNQDYEIVSEFDDMTTISQFYQSQNNVHTHDFFEIDYVFS